MSNPSRKPIPIKAIVFIAAVVAAPFLALVFGVTSALVVLAAALAMTTWLLWDARATAEPTLQPRLRLIALLNGFLLLVVVVVIVLRLAN